MSSLEIAGRPGAHSLLSGFASGSKRNNRAPLTAEQCGRGESEQSRQSSLDATCLVCKVSGGMHFAKLFSTILDSSVWTLDDHTRLVWITLLAMADQYGEVHAAIPGVARRAAVPLEACEAALGKLGGPDPYSRTPDHDGRRLEAIPGGWRLINHGKYQQLMSAEQTKARKRKWWKENKGKGAAECHELDEPRQLDATTRRTLDAETPKLDANSTHSTHIELEVDVDKSLASLEGVRGRPVRAPKAPRPKASRFVPEDWQPNDAHQCKATELGVIMRRELDSFRAHEFRVPKTNWDLAFHAWLTRSAQYGTTSSSMRAPAYEPKPIVWKDGG